MNEQQHTPEPWSVNTHPSHYEGIIWGPKGPGHGAVAEVGGRLLLNDENRANALRIVACVNFCRGYPTLGLQEGPDLKEIINWSALTDELLGVCEAFAEAMRKNDRPELLDLVNALHRANAVIAKAKEER